MYVRLTPPLNAKGRYVLKPPFVAEGTVIYNSIALRKFSDIEEAGESVLEEYYLKAKLTKEDYQRDSQLGAVIVTLVDPYQNFLYVPDTYIASFPNMADVQYHHLVLSISAGPIPDYIPLDELKVQLSSLCSDLIGVENVVHEHSAPVRDAITPQQHETLEAARVGAIKLRETEHSILLALKAENTRLHEQIDVLVKILQDNGLLPEDPATPGG